LPGALPAGERDALLVELDASFGAATARRLWHTYGGVGSRQILRRAERDAQAGQRVGPGAEMLVAEFAQAFEHELAGSLTDCLQRRCMLGLAADFGLRLAPMAADWLVRLGIRDKFQAAEELAAYRTFARRFTRRSAAIDGLEP
jgi:glycerol-3-phosphate dehydrogenase